MPLQLQKRQSLCFRPLSNRLSNKQEPLEPGLPPKTSFFDSLPVELQVEIFSECLPPYSTFSFDEAPLTIARVCRAWKYFVFNTPKLWSAFEIKIEDLTRSTVKTCQENTHLKMKQWLLRSKPCPLSIRLIINTASRSSDSRFKNILDILESEARQWRNIEFTGFPMRFLEMQHILTDDFPALKSLVLRLRGPSTALPSLDLSLQSLPWQQIALIHLLPEDPNLINLDGCLDILAQTERLRECTLKLNCTMDLLKAHQHHSGKVSLPVLQNFTLYLHGNINAQTASPKECLAQFLDILSIPQLRTLHLGWFGSQYEHSDSTTHDLHGRFSSFFGSIAETLLSLTIAYIPFTENELRHSLFYLNNLSHLVLKYPLHDAYDDPITSSFLSSLSPTVSPAISLDDAPKGAQTSPVMSDAQAILLPMLQHCEIEGHGRGYTGSDLITFIESRSKDLGSDSNKKRGVMKIKSCRIFSTTVFDEDETEHYVRKWKNNGMDISLESLMIR